MIRELTLTIVCLGLLLGCTGTQPQTTFIDNTFTSDFPKLKVRILKNVSKQKEESKQAPDFRMTKHLYLADSGEVIGITIWRFRHASNKEWRSSNEQLVRQIGGLPLDSITINNKTWLKFVQLNQEGNAALGYFTRMGDNLVMVYSPIKAKQYKDDIESFAKTRVLSEQLKQLITRTFDDIEELIVIDSYERIDKPGYGQALDTESKESRTGKKYIKIKIRDSVSYGGKWKFNVAPGDVLEVMRKKTCLGGKGECWEVKNIKTGETGFVPAERMKSWHYVYTKE